MRREELLMPSDRDLTTLPDSDERNASLPLADPASGFLVDSQEPTDDSGDGTHDQQAGSEHLFRQAVAPAPPSSPKIRPTFPQPDPAPNNEDDPALADGAQMARIGGFIAIGIGILALILTRELPLPAFLIVGGTVLAFYIGSPNRLRRDQIVDRWDCLIDGAQGRGDEVLDAVIGHIDHQELPDVAYDERDLAASLFRGGTRTFLVIWNCGNGRLKPYRMHVNVRDYGTNLQTSWFLTYHRSFFERLKPNPLVALNLFDEQDLRAYVTAAHHSFLDAVIDLMLSLGQDASRIDRKTNGFLGIS
jgi:hypothetical protein